MIKSLRISLLAILAYAVNFVQSGFLHSPLTYSSGFSAPPYLPYADPPPSHFAAPLPVDYDAGSTYSSPLPVAPISVNSYAATTHQTYAAPHAFVKHHSGFSPFTSYSALSPAIKFAASSHNPSLYSGPLPYGFAAPAVAYSGFGGQNAVVKYGPPITTTTTTYSTAASGAVGPVATAFAAHYAGRIGW